MFVLQVKSKVFFIQKVHIFSDYKLPKLGLQKLHICPNVTKMESIIGHRIAFNGPRALKRPAAHTQQPGSQIICAFKVQDYVQVQGISCCFPREL